MKKKTLVIFAVVSFVALTTQAQEKLEVKTQKTLLKKKVSNSFLKEESSVLTDFNIKQNRIVDDMYSASANTVINSKKLGNKEVSVKFISYQTNRKPKTTLYIVD